MATVERLKVLQAAMREQATDLVVVGPSANMRYLTGYSAMAVERITVLLVTPDSAAMVMPYFDATEFREATAFEDVFEWRDKHGPADAIDEAFRSLGLNDNRISAAVDDELRFDFLTQLRDHLDGHPRRAGELIGPLRLAKTAEEQGRIRRAGELVSHGIDVALDAAQPGITELQLKRIIENALWDAGAESVDFVLVQAGANSAIGHHGGDGSKLQEQQPVLVDIAARVDGYFADITQQVFLGDPPQEYIRMYEIVSAAQEQGVRATCAGVSAGEIDRVTGAVIDAEGFEDRGPRTGHGIGLDIHEPPSVIDGDETKLPAGATITIEPGIYMAGRFGIRIEDTVIVTAEGAERVTRGARPLLSK